MRRVFTWPRAILLFPTTLGLAAWWVPQLSADRYREPIHSALENALGRKVRIGTVKFSLLPVPGFTVKDVIIGEDPSIGVEPIAYVTTLRARPALGALAGGALTFASVDLEDASLNLTRVDHDGSNVRWNFAALMNPKLLATFPNIHMTGGRVNFKFQDTKSIFYLVNTDVDVWPPNSADGPWTLKIRAEPARTDRPSRGFAAFTARGQWSPKAKTIMLDARLEKSELGDMVTLFEGYESNLHGHVSGTAHFAGPMNRVGVDGRIAIDEIHGWNQTPPGGGAWPFAISGVIDFPGQDIELRALVAGGRASPLDLRYHVADYLGRPRWGANAILSGLPVAPLAAMARNLGLAVPADMTIEGTADGAVGYSYLENKPRMDGQLRVAHPRLRFYGAPGIRVPEVNLRFDGVHVNMPAVVLTNDENESATLQWDWDAATRDFQASLASEGMSIASLRRQLGAASVPLLGQATSGTWSGEIDNEAGDDGWSGDVHLADVVLPFEAFSEPLHLLAADATVEGASFSLRHISFRLGQLEGTGDYNYEAEALRPHRFRVAFATADAAAIERLLVPTLRRGSFLNYAFNFGRVPEPGWMQAMHADGAIEIGTFTLAGKTYSKLRGRALWDGAEVHLAQLGGSYGDTDFAGVADVNLASREPVYKVSGKLTGLQLQGGTASAEGTLESSGSGHELLTRMSLKGSLRARAVELGAGPQWDLVQACFEWDLRDSRLQLTQLVMTRGRDTYTGAAEMKGAGDLDVRAASGTTQLNTSVKLVIQ